MKKTKKVAGGLIGVMILLIIGISGVSALAEKTTIEFGNAWTLAPGQGDVWKAFIKKFNKENPEINVKVISIPYQEYGDKMKTLLAAGEAPDCFYLRNTTLKFWESMGWLEPLETYIDFKELMPKFCSPEVQMLAEIDGHMYALVTEIGEYAALFYNKRMFRDAGVTVPTNPQDFLDVALKLTKAPDQYGFISANRPANPTYLMQHSMITIHGFGGKILQRGEFVVDDLDFIEGLEYYKKLYDSGVMPKQMPYTTQRKMFWAGKAAMCMDGGYWWGWTKRMNPETAKHMGVASLPYRDKSYPAEISWLAIAKDSPPEKKKAAAKFLKAYMEPEMQKNWFEINCHPCTMSYGITPEFKKEHPWIEEVLLKVLPFGIPLTLPGYETQTEEIRKIVSDHIGEVLLSEKPNIRQIMRKARVEIEKLVGLK